MSAGRPEHVDANPWTGGRFRFPSGWYIVMSRGRDQRRVIVEIHVSLGFHIASFAAQLSAGDEWVIDDERAVWTGPFAAESDARRWRDRRAPRSGGRPPPPS